MSLIYIKDEQIFKKTDNNIEIVENIKIDKDDIITSSLSIKEVITYTFKLPLSTPKEQLDAECDIQFYENAGLDLNKQYKHFYIKKELEKENVYLIEAIAIEISYLETKFKSILEKVGYFDYISLSSFAFGEFYNLYNKEKKRDAFVYLDNNQSFITIYENGEYLYSKNLNPLNPLLKTLNVDYQKFMDLMNNKGVKKENYELDEFLLANEIDKFFSDYFIAINNRISYGRSIFYLENIDNIYFYTPFHIKDIDSLKDFWELSGVNFEIVQHEDINFLDKLSIYYNEKHYKDKINFSIFPKPPKFYKTKTFYLFLVIFLTTAIFCGDFFYRDYQNKQLQSQLYKQQRLLKSKQIKLNKLKKINAIIMKKIDITNKKIANIDKQIAHIKKVLQTSLVLTNTPKTNKDIINISNLLKKNKLHTFVISKDINNSFQIGVYTKTENRKYIANFMNDLASYNYQNIKTNIISSNKNSNYVSVIRFQK